jgi:hypothetical protein
MLNSSETLSGYVGNGKNAESDLEESNFQLPQRTNPKV